MTRTIRDVVVDGRSGLDVANAIISWAKTRGGYVVGGSAEYGQDIRITVQMGVGVFQSKRIFDMTLRSMPNGTLVHTEGYAQGLGQEMDLRPDAMNAALPRRDGWKEINDLWGWLAQLSVQPSSMHVPSVGMPTAAPIQSGEQPSVPPFAPVMQTPPVAQRFCPRCGTAVSATAKFCRNCGSAV